MLNGRSPSPESTTFPRDGNIGPHLAKIPAAILIRTLPPTPKKNPFLIPAQICPPPVGIWVKPPPTIPVQSTTATFNFRDGRRDSTSYR